VTRFLLEKRIFTPLAMKIIKNGQINNPLRGENQSTVMAAGRMPKIIISQ